ncbi:RNA methyltransferase [Aliiglaciecola lipolytica]|uniref:23S rRNA methyltransferase n=1 Tax=Aliiglaciecola lipolytica E3 TaxID=1127673 RepID=K6Y8U1_9ALTE|nr:RNA methyltransferase [Aliiglaciecola lipolytica]GAC14627.1 23S rRNA methyltransferase [Aliiglaciecola lipolytica E3]
MQNSSQKHQSNHYIVGLINPKSPSNVGAVLRAAGCYSAQSIVYTGKRYERAKSFATDTKNVNAHIPLTNIDNIFEDLPSGFRKIAFELVEGATPLPHFQHPENAIYVFGPEDGSIPQHVLNQCDDVVYVPTVGCMNLAASVNVVLYDRLAKQQSTVYSDDIIRSSRDTNNKLTFKTKNLPPN